MRYQFLIFCSVLLFQFTQIGFAQEVPNLIKGVVKDSLTGKPIPSATATVYLGKDSVVLEYAFTNTSGAFKFKGLPYDTPLLVVISHLSYNLSQKTLQLAKADSEVNLATFLMSAKSNLLREVAISGQKPPVLMKGDTLIINPGAFKTKENAVVEDVLRKVPGVVVWADGKISVNGKAVSQLLVDGKPFFGGDPVVAIRNLPKGAIDKIRVYDDKTAEDQFETDARLIMDLTLKNGLRVGAFGKVGGGVGTDKRYEGNAAINVFTPKNQVSLMTVANNINKEVYNVLSMLRQTVYKPGGNDNTSYQSNFGMEGLNDFKAVGINFERDWSSIVNSKTEYFNHANYNSKRRSIDQVTTLDEGYLNMQSMENANSSIHKQFLNMTIKAVKPEYEFRLEPRLEKEKSRYDYTNETFTNNEIGDPISGKSSSTITNADSKSLNIFTEYIDKNKTYFTQRYILRYRLYVNDYEGQEQLTSTFTNYDGPADPAANIDRKKHESKRIVNQSLFGEVDLNDIWKIKGKVNYKLFNTLSYITQDSRQAVNRFDQSSSAYIKIDPYLTNTGKYRFLQEKPGFSISRTIRKNAVRNRKWFTWNAAAELAYLNQDNNSQKAFQRLERRYLSFLPSFSFRFNQSKEGEFDKSYTLNYNTHVEIPTIEQLAPLIDSASQYYMVFGNNRLKEQYTNEIKLSFQRIATKGTGIIRLEVKMGITNDKLADSSLYDAAGRRISYTINADGFKYLSASASYEKSGKLFKNPIGVKLYPRINVSTNPFYLNRDLKTSRNLHASLLGMINYAQNDLLVYDLYTNLNVFKNKIDDRQLGSVMISNGGSIQLSWPKHTTVVNALNYEVNINSYSKTLKTFIWNINLYYRLLKNEQLELRFAATDLLRQRTNVIRYIDNNTIRSGTVNNLRQFFMAGISYYPRQFGRKRK